MSTYVYPLNGTELKEVKEQECECGTIVTTFYTHPDTKELLRKDVNVVVDPDKLPKIGAKNSF